jgi:hypothetical protein
VRSADLKIVDGAVAGAWVKPRLGGEFAAVTCNVPEGFEAYARIFHPAADRDWKPVSWTDVASVFGTTPHREMQWHAILGFAHSGRLRSSYDADTVVGSQWGGHDPPTGAMNLETLDSLCEVLADHTEDPGNCFFGLCTIELWEESFTPEELNMPLLQLPLGRDHIVLAGPLSAVDQLENDDSANPGPSRAHGRFVAYPSSVAGESAKSPPNSAELPHLRAAPNLIWPADHTWLVASEVDFDSTLVGGRRGLIEAIVESPELEAWRVEPTDSLAADADKVNSLPDAS